MEYETPYHWKMVGLHRAIALERLCFAMKYVGTTDRVIDIGCGDGYLTDKLAEICREIVGVDTSASGLDFARKLINKKNTEFIRGEAMNLPFQENSFDVVTCFEVIEHIPEKSVGEAIAEIERVLCENGLIILTTPNRENMQNRLWGYEKPEKHRKEYTISELLCLFNHFEAVEVSGIFLPFPFLRLFVKPRYQFIYRKLIDWGHKIPELSRHIAYCGKLSVETLFDD